MFISRSALTATFTRLGACCAAAALLTLTACAPSDPAQSGQSATKPGQQQGIELELPESLTNQKITWGKCEDKRTAADINSGKTNSDIECATIKAPLNYDDPTGKTIDLVVARNIVEDKTTAPKKYLFSNPGGPGGSGVDFLSYATGSIFSPDLRDEYYLVSFDPRGVQRSTPVDCFSDAELDKERSAPSTPLEKFQWKQALKKAEQQMKQCHKRSGEIVNHVSTVDAAKDLELFRQLFKLESLDYLGYSYGTKLGATYAQLFPQHVGRMVLDGVLGPHLSAKEVSLSQMKGFEKAINSWAEATIKSSDSPFYESTADEVKKYVTKRLDQLSKKPEIIEGRKLTASIWMEGLIAPLYSKEGWTQLDQALAFDKSGDGSLMLELSDVMNDREPDGSYSANSSEAFTIINCSDYGGYTDEKQLREEYKEVTNASPLLGKFFASTDLFCNAFKRQPAANSIDYNYDGVPPILVVGTTGDPATPYEWAEDLHKKLPGSRLLTFEGEGHTAYGKNNCVDSVVDNFLIDGVMPSANKTCK